MNLVLGPLGIANLLGVRDLTPTVRQLVNKFDFTYEPLTTAEQSEVLRQEATLITTPHADAKRWDAYWRDVKAQWEYSRDSKQLVPEFLRAPPPHMAEVRLFGEYIRTRSPEFVWSVQRIILAHLAERYLIDVPKIFEFGCGSGFNLVELRNLPLRQWHLTGLDRSEAAVEIVEELGFNALHFDLLQDPQPCAPELIAHAGVLTMGALEQVGDRFEPFLRWLLKAHPAVCVHVEPLVELYNKISFDDVAARYHHARGYLKGFLPALRELESQGKLSIIEVHRTNVGSRHNDGFSWVVWGPA